MPAQLTGNHAHALPGRGMLDPWQLVGKPLAKAAVKLANAFSVRRRACQAAGIDPLLDRDMRHRLPLKIALPAVCTVVVAQRPLDIDRMGVVPFDQVAAVAAHRPDELRQGFDET